MPVALIPILTILFFTALASALGWHYYTDHRALVTTKNPTTGATIIKVGPSSILRTLRTSFLLLYLLTTVLCYLLYFIVYRTALTDRSPIAIIISLVSLLIVRFAFGLSADLHWARIITYTPAADRADLPLALYDRDPKHPTTTSVNALYAEENAISLEIVELQQQLRRAQGTVALTGESQLFRLRQKQHFYHHCLTALALDFPELCINTPRPRPYAIL